MAGGARKWARVSKMGARNLGLDRLGLGCGSERLNTQDNDAIRRIMTQNTRNEQEEESKH